MGLSIHLTHQDPKSHNNKNGAEHHIVDQWRQEEIQGACWPEAKSQGRERYYLKQERCVRTTPKVVLWQDQAHVLEGAHTHTHTHMGKKGWVWG